MKNVNAGPAVTLREPAELLAHGLVSTNAIADLEKVAARYAVAVTPDGGTIFALLRQGGRIVRLAASSGTVQATVPGTDYDRLLGVIPW